MKSANWRDRRFMDVGTTADDNDTNDEEDDESIDGWIMSPASSQGRSSISSIPWAEDAIKQNQDEWEAIEAMFYGERALPNDPKLRQEFQEWMTKFPHLRIVGRQIVPTKYDSAVAPEAPENLGNQIELCMRITSGPLLAKRGKSGRLPSSSRSDWPITLENSPTRVASSSVRSELMLDERSRSLLLRKVPTTLSARIVKMPSILNISNYGRRREQQPIDEPAAAAASRIAEEPEKSRRPLRCRVTLPAIQLNRQVDMSFQTELVGRSISAIQQPTARNMSLRRRNDQF